MGLNDVVRRAVAVPVYVRRQTTDRGGNVTGTITKTFRALVEQQTKRFQTSAGVEVVATAKLTFLQDVHVEDTIVVGGRVAHVVTVERVFDPSKSAGGYVTEVWIAG